MRANQLRLWLQFAGVSAAAGSAAIGLKGTALAQAQCDTIRLKLLKIGALIRITVRKVWFSLASGYPYAELFATVHARLQCPSP